MNISFALENDSIVSDLFRSYEEPEYEEKKPLTFSQRFDYFKKSLWNLMICGGSIATSYLLLSRAYSILYIEQSKTEQVHEKYDIFKIPKYGEQWDKEIREAYITQNNHDVGSLIFLGLVGGITYYNLKQKTFQRTFSLFKKVIQ